MKEEYGFPRSGWFWRTMGFTGTHLVGVFVTESLLGALGAIIAVAAIAGVLQDTIAWLLGAVCILLLQLSVLLSSILSRLFFMGTRGDRATEKRRSNDADSAG